LRRQPRVDDDDDGGLDSLLDTMTNVVGILVLVLIVAQMGIADVVNRVVTENQVDQETMDATKWELVQKKIEQTELQTILYEPLEIDVELQREELARKKELLERRKKLLAEKQKTQNQNAIKIEQDTKQAEMNREELVESKTQREEFEKLISTSLEQKAQLEAILADTPITDKVADIEISIPNPRPAPKGAKQLLLFCVNNRLYPVNVEKFQKSAEAKAKQIVTRFNLLRDPAKGIDPEEFEKRFTRLKDQDNFFDIEYYVDQKKHLRIRFIPRKNGGASFKEVTNRRSRIHTKLINRIDSSKYYARFYVLPDSYEVYTAARRAFSEAQVLAGWEPQTQDWVYTTSVPGGIVLGPPPKPKPTPPSPKTPPKPAKPVKPPNLID